jgi:hypothetical protein
MLLHDTGRRGRIPTIEESVPVHILLVEDNEADVDLTCAMRLGQNL